MLLTISISGFWPIIITHGIVAAAAFIAGALVYKNNDKAANARLTAMENKVAQLETAIKK